jgi:hypothetical protein
MKILDHPNIGKFYHLNAVLYFSLELIFFVMLPFSSPNFSETIPSDRN